MHFVHSISNARPWKIKDGIRFSFDILFIFDFDVCVGTEENLMLKQEVAWFNFIIFRLLQDVYYMIVVTMQSEVQQENLRDKKGRFKSRKQLAKLEQASILHHSTLRNDEKEMKSSILILM